MPFEYQWTFEQSGGLWTEWESYVLRTSRSEAQFYKTERLASEIHVDFVYGLHW
jgi:hypothetical protein